MKKFVGAILFLFIALNAQARWSCELECKISEDQEIARIRKHASGEEYDDFYAECKQRGGYATSLMSGCEYSYCKIHSNRTEITSGYGETLTEARKDARETCKPTSESSCGLLNVRTICKYKCTEY